MNSSFCADSLAALQAQRWLLEVERGGLSFEVKVLSVRCVFGRTDYFVAPIAGRGKSWVSADRCIQMEEKVDASET